MSYGLIASKNATLKIERAVAPPVAADDTTGEMFEKFLGSWGPLWVPGRVMLTKLRLTFIPTRLGGGSARLDLDLRRITQVELTAGRVNRVITVRTRDHAARIKLLAAPALAQQIAVQAEAARGLQRPSNGNTLP